MPAAALPVPSATAARPAPPPPPSASIQKADRPDRSRESRAGVAAERAVVVAPEPHWTAAIDAATD